MDYLHVKKIEKYHPSYKDRDFTWFKIHLRLLYGHPTIARICETDRFRLLSFIGLEVQLQEPVPLDKNFLMMKGFRFKNRPLSLTLKALEEFTEILSKNSSNEFVTKSGQKEHEFDTYKREEKIRVKTAVDSVVTFFNSLTGQRVRADSSSNAKPIKSIIEKGYTVEDCCTVIQKKYDQWYNDEKMAKFVRISTLFRPSHFDEYLNEKEGKQYGDGEELPEFNITDDIRLPEAKPQKTSNG